MSVVELGMAVHLSDAANRLGTAAEPEDTGTRPAGKEAKSVVVAIQDGDVRLRLIATICDFAST